MAQVTITLTDEGNMVNTNIDFGISEDQLSSDDASPAQILGNLLMEYIDRLAIAADKLKEAEDAPADAA